MNIEACKNQTRVMDKALEILELCKYNGDLHLDRFTCDPAGEFTFGG